MRALMWTALATALLLAGSGAAWANDIVRLGGPSAQVGIQGGADTELVHARYYGGYHGGARYYGSYYHRPYYYSSYYYRPYYYRPYVNFCTPYYYPTYYYREYYYPLAGNSVSTVTLQTTGNSPLPPANGDGTFPYDGGPHNPIPMPNPMDDTNPTKNPRGIVPLDGRLVTLPITTTGGISPVTAPAIQRLRFVTTPSATPIRVTYPAYGEEPIPPAPRKAGSR